MSRTAFADLDTLQAALTHLLQRHPNQGYLVVRLAVEKAPADVVAAETGIDPRAQVAAARAALAALALEDESVAFAGAVEEPGLGAAMRATKQKRLRPADRNTPLRRGAPGF
jgi:hypothetical protein